MESSTEDFNSWKVDFTRNFHFLYIVFSLDEASLVYTKIKASISTEGMCRGTQPR